MKLFLNSIFVFVCFFSYQALGEEFYSNYIIKVGGMKIGNLEWSLELNNNKYENSLRLYSGGLLSAIYKFEGNYLSKGVFENGLIKTKKYSHFWKTKKTTKKMYLLFNNNKVVSLKQSPTEKESLRVNIFEIKNTKDPISAFLEILMGKKTALVIDGRRFYRMKTNNISDSEQTTVELDNYSNLWADHKRRKFEKITFFKSAEDLLPLEIRVFFDNKIFKLKKI